MLMYANKSKVKSGAAEIDLGDLDEHHVEYQNATFAVVHK